MNIQRSRSHHHTERVFRRYEAPLSEVVANYPEHTVFSSFDTTPGAFITGMRNAIRAMELNGWTSEHFTIDDLRRVFSSFHAGGTHTIRHALDGTVICGPRMKNNVPDAAAYQTNTVVRNAPEIRIPGTDNVALTAVCVLKQKGYLPSIEIDIDDLPADKATELEQTYPMLLLVCTDPTQNNYRIA